MHELVIKAKPSRKKKLKEALRFFMVRWELKRVNGYCPKILFNLILPGKKYQKPLCPGTEGLLGLIVFYARATGGYGSGYYNLPCGL
jgi:hypothetical protein